MYIATYFYENSTVGANVRVFTGDSLIWLKEKVYNLLYATVSNLDESWIENMIWAIESKYNWDVEDDYNDDVTLESSDGDFRFTIDDETHACKFDLVVDDLSIELS